MKIKKLIVKSLKILMPGVIAWGVGIILAFVIPYESVYVKGNVIHDELDCLQNQSNITSEELFVNILETNLKCIGINVVGMVTFGIITYVNLFFNGFMHGVSIRYSLIKIGGETWIFICPHSFELLGLFISGGSALYGTKIFMKILKNDQINLIKMTAFLFSSVLLSVVIIIAAAYVEAYITYQSI